MSEQIAIKITRVKDVEENWPPLETRRLPLQKIADLNYLHLCNEVDLMFPGVRLKGFNYYDEDKDICGITCTKDLITAAEVTKKILRHQTLHLFLEEDWNN